MKRIRPSRFYGKMLTAFVLIGVIPLFVTGIIEVNSYGSRMHTLQLSSMKQQTKLSADRLDSFLKELQSSTEYIYYLSLSEDINFNEIFQDEEISAAGLESLVLRSLQSILYRNDAYEHVMFLMPDGRQYVSMRPPVRIPDREELQKFADMTFDRDSREMKLLGEHESSYLRSSEGKVLTAYRNIMDTSSVKNAQDRVLGTLYIDFGREDILNAMGYGSAGETDPEGQAEIYIIDSKNGQEIFNEPGAMRLDERFPEVDDLLDRYKTVEKESSGTQKTNEDQIFQSNDHYLIFSPIGRFGCYLLYAVPEKVIDGRFYQWRMITMLLITVLAGILILIYSLYSRSLNRPIREIGETMDRIKSGDLDARIQTISKDEIGQIALGLNDMASELKQYINQVYLSEIRQRDAEVSALKYQIQPHFLYNTLDAIRMSAISHDDRDTANMLFALSGQLRYLTAHTGDYVMLREELDHIRSYFSLIRVRFENRFSFHLNCPEELYSYPVPHLILQPLVENAVNHGLRQRPGTGTVAISCTCSENDLIIVVSDDGAGMHPDKLQELKKALADEDGRLTSLISESRTQDQEKEMLRGYGIGMCNVAARIRLYYGSKYGMTVRSCPGEGTEVTLHLPAISGRE